MDGCGLHRGQVFVAIPQKNMVVSKIPSCLHARLEEIIYKYVKNIETFDWKTLMFHFGLWRSLSQSQHPSLEKTAGTKVLQKLWPMDCFVHMVLSPPISCLMLTSSYPQGSKHISRFTFPDHCFVWSQAAPLAAYGNALASKPGISFSIQVRGP